ncbi:hypothetical protein DEJ34_05995 [Curtobacterium sp. MCPF17_050]|uniref:hypothetical protein n=1 Tax=Curtobacterium sp. MCPF17_050 TaxID=2175664 RepID=UPI000D950D26|nr:hypothetical protein [Curtobacterium sp. MCPF17_050]WIB16678.1 hypothetical protein DEJ34_05995 [Curtobacterium sp. MCPF17_050]
MVDEEKYSKHEVAFAHEVARRRELRGWTLQQMADALRREGVEYASAMTVSRTEKLNRPARMNEALAYGRIFGSTVNELTSGAEVDHEIVMANEIAAMALDYSQTVLRSVQRAHQNWAAAIQLRDTLHKYPAQELSSEQLERRDHAVAQLNRVIELDLMSEMSRAWEEAPR